MVAQSNKRNVKDGTIGPVLSWTNEEIASHINAVLELDGVELMHGGKPLRNHSIPKCYGSYEPTTVKVPLKHFRGKKKRELLTTELFGPFQILVEYGDKDIDYMLETLNSLPNYLTAAIVSNDPHFTEYCL